MPDITLTQLARLQGAYEAAGVRIGYDGTVWVRRAANDAEHERVVRTDKP